MRFETDYANVNEHIEENDVCHLDIMVDEPADRIKFKFDFPELDKEDAEKLELSDADIGIMVQLYLEGNHSGMQEYWYENEDGDDVCTNLTWENSNSFQYH